MTGKERLVHMLNDLLGRELTPAEHEDRLRVLYELEYFSVVDGHLTWDDVHEVEREWFSRKGA